MSTKQLIPMEQFPSFACVGTSWQRLPDLYTYTYTIKMVKPLQIDPKYAEVFMSSSNSFFTLTDCVLKKLADRFQESIQGGDNE